MSPSSSFTPVIPGSGLPAGTPAASTPKKIPHRGGPVNPTVDALREKFGAAIQRADVVWGETTVVVERTRVAEIVRWLHDDPGQSYVYLSDVTAVENRDVEQPLEVVWHLRSLAFRRFLRLKALLPKGTPLEVPSVFPIFKSADWMERECFDMFGVKFAGHPDLRRILMYEEFTGYPLRKDYPANKTQPLVPYREGTAELNRMGPFLNDEGMPFNRSPARDVGEGTRLGELGTRAGTKPSTGSAKD